MIVVGRRSDESLVEINIDRTKTDPDYAQWQSAVVMNHGGAIGDYSWYEGTYEEKGRVLNGDGYELTWDPTEITGLDFSPEDNLLWINCFVKNNPTKFRGNLLSSEYGVNTIAVTLQILESDGETIDTSYNNSKRLFVDCPGIGPVKMQMTFVDGECTFNFQTSRIGTWVFPSGDKYNAENGTKFRIKESSQVHVYLDPTL